MSPSLAAAALSAPILVGLLMPLSRAEPGVYTPTCTWSPAGPVSLAPDAEQTFTSGFGCSGYTVTISPANGTAGFTAGSACDLTEVTTSGSGIFKVRACEVGSVTVTIRSGSTVVQTISVSVQA